MTEPEFLQTLYLLNNLLEVHNLLSFLNVFNMHNWLVIAASHLNIEIKSRYYYSLC